MAVSMILDSKERGVRPGVTSLYKSSFTFQGEEIPETIELRAYGDDCVEYQVSLSNPLEQPEPAWTYVTERLNVRDKPILERLPTSANRGDPEHGLAALQRASWLHHESHGRFLRTLSGYRIFTKCVEMHEHGGPDGGGYLANTDILIVHVDGEVADESTVSCAKPCPPASDTADNLEQVVRSWMGNCSNVLVVVAIPMKETEAWIFAALRPTDKLLDTTSGSCFECRDKPSTLLSGGPVRLIRSGKKHKFAYREIERQLGCPLLRSCFSKNSSRLFGSNLLSQRNSVHKRQNGVSGRRLAEWENHENSIDEQCKRVVVGNRDADVHVDDRM